MTAVEWFWNEIKHILPNDFLVKYEQAKEREKEQIIKAVYHTCSAMSHSDIPCGEQYYNETFKSE